MRLRRAIIGPLGKARDFFGVEAQLFAPVRLAVIVCRLFCLIQGYSVSFSILKFGYQANAIIGFGI
jgi:hypothetical protein